MEMDHTRLPSQERNQAMPGEQRDDSKPNDQERYHHYPGHPQIKRESSSHLRPNINKGTPTGTERPSTNDRLHCPMMTRRAGIERGLFLEALIDNKETILAPASSFLIGNRGDTIPSTPESNTKLGPITVNNAAEKLQDTLNQDDWDARVVQQVPRGLVASHGLHRAVVIAIRQQITISITRRQKPLDLTDCGLIIFRLWEDFGK
jgi:hypothetical protein